MKGKARYISPVGPLFIESDNDDRVIAVRFVTTDYQTEMQPTPGTDHCVRELEEYFSKGRKFFTFDMQLIGTSFEKKVWTELLNIPYGRTISYQELAVRTGDPKSIRAAAAATGDNPLAIVIPCHRVIGSNGDLVGYGGGLDKKEWLLNHEGAIARQLHLF